MKIYVVIMLMIMDITLNKSSIDNEIIDILNDLLKRDKRSTLKSTSKKNVNSKHHKNNTKIVDDTKRYDIETNDYDPFINNPNVQSTNQYNDNTGGDSEYSYDVSYSNRNPSQGRNTNDDESTIYSNLLSDDITQQSDIKTNTDSDTYDSTDYNTHTSRLRYGDQNLNYPQTGYQQIRRINYEENDSDQMDQNSDNQNQKVESYGDDTISQSSYGGRVGGTGFHSNWLDRLKNIGNYKETIQEKIIPSIYSGVTGFKELISDIRKGNKNDQQVQEEQINPVIYTSGTGYKDIRADMNMKTENQNKQPVHEEKINPTVYSGQTGYKSLQAGMNMKQGNGKYQQRVNNNQITAMNYEGKVGVGSFQSNWRNNLNKKVEFKNKNLVNHIVKPAIVPTKYKGYVGSQQQIGLQNNYQHKNNAKLSAANIPQNKKLNTSPIEPIDETTIEIEIDCSSCTTECPESCKNGTRNDNELYCCANSMLSIGSLCPSCAFIDTSDCPLSATEYDKYDEMYYIIEIGLRENYTRELGDSSSKEFKSIRKMIQSFILRVYTSHPYYQETIVKAVKASRDNAIVSFLVRFTKSSFGNISPLYKAFMCKCGCDNFLLEYLFKIVPANTSDLWDFCPSNCMTASKDLCESKGECNGCCSNANNLMNEMAMMQAPMIASPILGFGLPMNPMGMNCPLTCSSAFCHADCPRECCGLLSLPSPFKRTVTSFKQNGKYPTN